MYEKRTARIQFLILRLTIRCASQSKKHGNLRHTHYSFNTASKTKMHVIGGIKDDKRRKK